MCAKNLPQLGKAYENRSYVYEKTFGIRAMKNGQGRKKMLTLRGKGVSPGMAQGKAFVYKDVLLRDSELYLIDDRQIDDEKEQN
jgi:phosphoenolpyruvate synthase/pyruvate phosphate dikinase